MFKQIILSLIFSLYAASMGAMVRTLLRPAQKTLTTVRSENANNYQQFVRHQVEQAIHQLYAGINHLRAALTCKASEVPEVAQALEALQKSDAALENIAYLFDPKKINQNPLMNSLAYELSAGIAHQRAFLRMQINRLENEPPVEREDVIVQLEKLLAARAQFFAQFMQWDTRLEPACQIIQTIEQELHAIKTAAAEGSLRQAAWNALFGAIQCTPAQQRALTGYFQQLADAFKELAASKDIDIEKRLYMKHYSQIVAPLDYEQNLAQNKKLLEAFNLLLLTPTIERCGKENRFGKSTLFPAPHSSFTGYKRRAQDLRVFVYDKLGLSSCSLHNKIEMLEKLCGELAVAIAPEGSFEKQLDALMLLAQKLKDEKAVVKEIAEQVQHYNIEHLVGFTDLMQKIANLVQDIAKTDSSWGSLLQKINPDLHAFLRSARNEKIGETLEAAREIAKTMGYKQPISQLALICARHGATIKLALEAAKPLVQKTAPLFSASKHSLSGYAKTLSEFGHDMQVDAFDMQVASFDAHDSAQAFQLLAQTSKNVDTMYIQYSGQLEQRQKQSADHEFINERAVNDEQRQPLSAAFKTVWELRLKLWNKQHAQEQLSETYQKAYARWQRCMLGWLYQRLYLAQQRKSLELLAQGMQLDVEELCEQARLIDREFETMAEKRHHMYEPICTERLAEFVEKTKVKHDGAALQENKEILLQQEKAIQLQVTAKKIFPRWNLTNICAYIWWLLNYPRLYYAQASLRQQLALIQYQQGKLAAVHEQLKKKNENLYAKKYKTPDEICKNYLVTLHPAFAIL